MIIVAVNSRFGVDQIDGPVVYPGAETTGLDATVIMPNHNAYSNRSTKRKQRLFIFNSETVSPLCAALP
jgi:hypothetical protein